MNDLDIHAHADEAFELLLAVVEGRIRDVTAIAERLRPSGRQAELRARCRSMLPAGSFELTARAWVARGAV